MNMLNALHLFVPENDLALASGLARYTPVPVGWHMHLSGEALPMWYADRGDRVMSFGMDARWLDGVSESFDTGVDVASRKEIASGCLSPSPWGWSAYTRQMYADAGCPQRMLPSDEAVGRMRMLSHRRSSVCINEALSGMLGFPLPAIPVETDDLERLSALVEGVGGYLKQPWSSSGRGVIDASRLSGDVLRRQAGGIIRRQGSVMWEEPLAKIMDFAALFRSDGAGVGFEGWSMFETSPTGEYAGNVLASQEYMRGSLERYIPGDVLDEVVVSLCRVLADYVCPVYKGYMGVDMMVYDRGGVPALAPCVELNLRATMGVVALGFSRRYLAPGCRGVMRVVASGDVPPQSYVMDGGRMAGGVLHLSPPQRFAFVAEVRR